MRDLKNKSKTNSNNSISIQMELELAALRAKNNELTKSYAKNVKEIAEMKAQAYSLRAELHDVQTKYNNAQASLKNLEQNMKNCTPNLVKILNLFLQVTDSPKNSSSYLNYSNRGMSPNVAKTITHSVKPHTVNGTVLNLNPTISLSRLNTSSEIRNSPRMSLPSTSARESDNEILSPMLDNDNEEEGNISFVSRRCRLKRPSQDGALRVSTDLPEENDIENEEDNLDNLSEEDQEQEEFQRRLSTINEERESLLSSGRKRSSIEEVRIYLSRLSAKDLQARMSSESTEVNVDDTGLNFETTVIENPDVRASKRLRTDIMVFSPHTNSTRVECDNSFFDNDETLQLENRRSVSFSTLTEFQTSDLTPNRSTGKLNKAPDDLMLDRFSFLPTPSMSAIGDIDRSHGSKLEILNGLGLTESPIQSPMNDVSLLQVTSPLSTKRNTRSLSEKITKSRSNSKEVRHDSPKVLNTTRGTGSSVKDRTSSKEKPKTPTVLLERLDNVQLGLTQILNSPNGKVASPHLVVELENNENRPRREAKANHKFIRSNEMEKSERNGRVDDKNTHTHCLREIKIRLSNNISQSVCVDSSTDEEHRRPVRSARPKVLKDASLKKKLRRS